MDWAKLGLTDEVIEELYRRGRGYAARCIAHAHREDAVQEGMCRVLAVVLEPSEDYPEEPEARLNYLAAVLCNQCKKYVSRTLPQDTNIPID